MHLHEHHKGSDVIFSNHILREPTLDHGLGDLLTNFQLETKPITLSFCINTQYKPTVDASQYAAKPFVPSGDVNTNFLKVLNFTTFGVNLVKGDEIDENPTTNL